MIVNFTKEQIDFVKHCGEHFEVLTGGRCHSKTKQIIEELQQRIDKAIEYINSQKYEYDDGEISGVDCCCDGFKLLEILGGKE